MTVNRLSKRLVFDPSVYPTIIQLLTDIDSLTARFTVQSQLSPQVIDRLVQSVLITSTGSSTRIEGSLLSDSDVQDLYKKLRIQKFKTRDEQEVAGYLETLQLVFENWKTLIFGESFIKHVHSLILKHSAKDSRHRGQYKFQNNKVEAQDAEGNVVKVIFEPTPPYLTPKEMLELVEWYSQALTKKEQHPLLLIANFLFEFLAIHPFEDGNGRTSRVVTNFLLLKAGYEFTPFISHEKIVESRKVEYYQALNYTQLSWKKDTENVSKWVVFFLEVVKEQARQAVELLDKDKSFEMYLSPAQSKVWKVLQTGEELSRSEIQKRSEIPLSTVRQSLKKLLEMHAVEVKGEGRASRYVIKHIPIPTETKIEAEPVTQSVPNDTTPPSQDLFE